MPDSAASFDKPKGLGSLFVSTTCRPFKLMDINRCLKMQYSVLASLSYLVVTLSILLVPAWLWLVRFTYLRHSQLPCKPYCDLITFPQTAEAAIAVFVSGFILFTLADAIMRRDLKSRYSKTRARVTARNLTYTPAPPKVYTSYPAAAKPSLANGTTSTSGAAAARTTAAAPTASGSSTAQAGPTASGSSTAQAGLPNGQDKTQVVIQEAASQLAAQQKAALEAAQRSNQEWKAVQDAFYKLDHDLYGHDGEEVDLTKEELAMRIKALCADLHVDFHGSNITAKTMLATIDNARRSAGL